MNEFFDKESIRLIAKKIFETYDRNKNGEIDEFEVQPMMVDTYKILNKS